MNLEREAMGKQSFDIEPVTTEQLELRDEFQQIRAKRELNRRNFLRNVGLAGAAAAGAGFFSACGTSNSTVLAAGPSEADVLNFALNLEYLEAEFYLFTTTGQGLSSADQGSGAGPTTGGAKLAFSDPALAQIAAEITFDEMQHVKFLRSALGSAAVPKPAINLGAFGAVNNDMTFLFASRAFEDVGVSAYAGAATLLTGNNLQAAAQILGTEALHTGNIRLQVVQKNFVFPALDSLDKPPTSSQYFNVDSNALAVKRTPSQVLAIVLGGGPGKGAAPGTTKGGFFPNGVNGAINTV